MEISIAWIIAIAVVVLAAAYLIMRKLSGPRPRTPAALRPGNRLPDFAALDEQGNTVHSSDLRGAPAVILFVRGTWCPFCSKQVANLTAHYKDIVDLGAKLIFITPQPLATTRRVAEIFAVEFDFWLDESLAITRQLGLLHIAGVPGEHHQSHGEDTVWPTALVTDADGVIRYTSLSRFIFDRPNPQRLLHALRKL
ncbi:MAG: peroxiredoxin-like family protein [Gammaproteobacteria bacterium]|nr:MAG: peroxiredoxin-like family protein [Gammaproteobacteria bacterium]